MTWYLESLDLEVWKTILFGYTFLTKDVDGGKIRKTLDEYNEEESRKRLWIEMCIIELVNVKRLRRIGEY